MPGPSITKLEGRRIAELVATYQSHVSYISVFRDQLLAAFSSAGKLMQHVHSVRARLKDPKHLRDKLRRKLLECKKAGEEFDITPENLLLKINDLAGVRILHLYTRQIREIDVALRDIFTESRYELLEGPFARSWDDESRAFFKECGIETQESPTMYTSVHYVIGSASRTTVTAEIQVRTLMEEVWGEVDHSLNYPYRNPSLACREQLKVLARVTSSATRLVDSIFLTRSADACVGGKGRQKKGSPGHSRQARAPGNKARRRRRVKAKPSDRRKRSGV